MYNCWNEGNAKIGADPMKRKIYPPLAESKLAPAIQAAMATRVYGQAPEMAAAMRVNTLIPPIICITKIP